MRNFVRIISFILLLGTTLVFVLKIVYPVPVSHKHLIILFLIGAISLLWTNYRDKSDNKE